MQDTNLDCQHSPSWEIFQPWSRLAWYYLWFMGFDQTQPQGYAIGFEYQWINNRFMLDMQSERELGEQQFEAICKLWAYWQSNFWWKVLDDILRQEDYLSAIGAQSKIFRKNSILINTIYIRSIESQLQRLDLLLTWGRIRRQDKIAHHWGHLDWCFTDIGCSQEAEWWREHFKVYARARKDH